MSAALLEARRLTKTFGSGHVTVRAVDGVSLTVAPGEVVLLMGPSGSGKTTLLSMIGGILRPTSGEVAIGGVELTRLRRRELTRVRRDNVGFIFQTFNLLEALTARENVEIALNIAGIKRPEATERARRLLVDAGLEARLDFSASALSGGERQRVAIARALANGPRVLLADEPTGALDSATGEQIIALLERLRDEREMTILLVTNDDAVSAQVDRVLRIRDGVVIPAEALRSG